jgi:hypothetical protein
MATVEDRGKGLFLTRSVVINRDYISMVLVGQEASGTLGPEDIHVFADTLGW